MSAIISFQEQNPSDMPGYGTIITEDDFGNQRFYRLPSFAVKQLEEWAEIATSVDNEVEKRLSQYRQIRAEMKRARMKYFINGKEVDASSLEVDGIDMSDYPDFCDAYIDYGLFADGTEMSGGELELFEQTYSDKFGELIQDCVINRGDFAYEMSRD